MNKLKQAAAVTMIAGAVVAAGAGLASAHDGPGAAALGDAHDSPGVVSGNVIQVPVHIPVNAVGNSVNVIGLLNPAFGNLGVNR